MNTRSYYVTRINQVLDYIEAHLDEAISLEELASVACFSPWHLHRIFSAFVGEPLYQFILRLRLERAAGQLLIRPKDPVTEIALENGFATSASFARAFRKRFGMTAVEWRKRRTGMQPFAGTAAVRALLGEKPFDPDFPDTDRSRYHGTRITEFPAMKAAYVRYIGPYASDDRLFKALFSRLIGYLIHNGVELRKSMKEIILYHDNPEITDEDRLRVTVCLTLEEQADLLESSRAEGELGIMTLPGGLHACSSFSVHKEGFQEAWDWVYYSWLPGSGWEADNRPCFELYTAEHDSGSDPEFRFEICVPVRSPGR